MQLVWIRGLSGSGHQFSHGRQSWKRDRVRRLSLTPYAYSTLTYICSALTFMPMVRCDGLELWAGPSDQLHIIRYSEEPTALRRDSCQKHVSEVEMPPHSLARRAGWLGKQMGMLTILWLYGVTVGGCLESLKKAALAGLGVFNDHALKLCCLSACETSACLSGD